MIRSSQHLPLHAGMIALLWSVAWLSPLASGADDASQNFFDELFGTPIEKAKRTPSPVDDLMLVDQMLQTARSASDQKELATLLFENAETLASSHVSGYARAWEANRALAIHSPASQRDADRRAIDLLTRLSRTGPTDKRIAYADHLIELLTREAEDKIDNSEFDEAIKLYRRALVTAVQLRRPTTQSIREATEAALHQRKQLELIQSLEQRLLKNATDQNAAEQLIRLYWFELNDVPSAARYIDRIENKPLQQALHLAAKSDPTLTDHQALGEFYFAEAKAMPKDQRTALYQLAGRHYSLFLLEHTTKDVEHAKATLVLGQIKQEVEVEAVKKPTVISTPPTQSDAPAMRVVWAKYGTGPKMRNVTALAAATVVGSRLVIPVDNTLTGGRDPYPGWRKKMVIRYVNADGEHTKKIPANGLCVIGLPRKLAIPSHELVIAEARMGNRRKWIDVTEAVKKQVKNNKLEFTMSSSTLLDPAEAPSGGKSFYVIYRYKDMEQIATGGDNKLLKLPVEQP